MTAFLDRIEDALDAPIPARWRTFLENFEHGDLPWLYLRDGYVTGCFDVTFDDGLYLTSLEAIGEDYGIDDIGDIDWAADFAGYAPFATLDVLDEDGEADPEESADLGAFLVIKVDQPECPIFLFEREGWTLYPLARSLDAFVAGEAWTAGEPEPHDHLGAHYDAIEWVRELPDAE